MIRETLCALVAGTLLGCSGGVSKENEPKYETITGLPLSVAESYGRVYGSVAVVMQVGEKKILAINRDNYIGTENAAKAQALIQSEIADGDNEPVELYGSYQADGTFKMQSLRANGYGVDF